MAPVDEQTQHSNGAPAPPIDTQPKAVAAPVDLEVLRYKEELLEKMGLPSGYAMEQLRIICTDLVSSGFAPSHFKGNPMALFLAAMRGREMDLSPMESILETFWAAPGGRLGLYAGKMLAILHRNGVTSKFITETKESCEILFTPRPPHEPYTARFEYTEASNAGLVKVDSNWVKWPADMCRARAIARGWRALSGTFKGAANLYAKEELEDMPEEWSAAQPDIQEGQPVVEVTAGRRKKTAAPGPVVVEMPQEAGPSAEAKLPEPGGEVTKGGEVFVIDHPGELPHQSLDSASLRAQAIANEKRATIKLARVSIFSDGSLERVEIATFNPPATDTAAAAVTEVAPAAAAPVTPVDPAKEALIKRAQAAYAAIPAADEKLRKQIGDCFCSGFYGVSVPREWPRNIEDRTRGVEALEAAISTDLKRLVDSPVTAKNFGREMAAKAAEPKAAAAPDMSAALYKRLNWSDVTAAVAGAFKAKFGIEAQDFSDYIASLKLDTLPEDDARAYMAIGALVGRTFKTEGTAEPVFPMKTLFSLAEKGAGSYSTILQTLQMHNQAQLAAIPPAKIMADLTKMLTGIETAAAAAKATAPADDDSSW